MAKGNSKARLMTPRISGSAGHYPIGMTDIEVTPAVTRHPMTGKRVLRAVSKLEGNLETVRVYLHPDGTEARRMVWRMVNEAPLKVIDTNPAYSAALHVEEWQARAPLPPEDPVQSALEHAEAKVLAHSLINGGDA